MDDGFDLVVFGHSGTRGGVVSRLPAETVPMRKGALVPTTEVDEGPRRIVLERFSTVVDRDQGDDDHTVMATEEGVGSALASVRRLRGAGWNDHS